MQSRWMYWSVTLLFVFALALSLESRAYAYTDPGSCLLLFQSIGAVASGALFYFRRRLKRLFNRSDSKQPVSPSVAMSRADS